MHNEGVFMKQFYMRLIRLIFGLFVYAVGIVFTINAQIGYTTWDVLHVGMSKTIGMTIGSASIIVGMAVVFISFLLGEKLGLGTLLNMILIGLFIDLIMHYSIIPVSNQFFTGILMMVIGLFIIALASFFYMGSAFGAGPRDSLMVALTRKTGLPIGICRAALDFSAAVVGWKLGGMLGLGTVISAFGGGFFIQVTFRLLRFDAKTINHETLNQTYRKYLLNKAA